MGWLWLLLLTWDLISLPSQGTLLYLLYLLSLSPPPCLDFWADFKSLEKTKIKPRNLNPLGTTPNFLILFYFIIFICFVVSWLLFFWGGGVCCCFFLI